MKRVLSVVLLAGYSVFWFGCKDGDPVVPKVSPTNLTLDPVISNDGSGLVTFKATADNTEKYYFYFGDDESAAPVLSTDGNAEHTYTQSGTYTVKVMAVSVDNLSLSKTTDVTVNVAGSDAGYSTPLSYDGKTLVWNDEFDGTSLNSSFWSHETGGGGWGNNELELYQAANTTVSGGNLIITAKKETVGSNSYTSSRIVTKSKKEFQYGRVDIRAKLPKGQGLWPALWTLGSNISTAGWPACGEIDIMEMIGGGAGRDNKVYGTAHWSNAGTQADYGGNKTLSSGNFIDQFHVFTIIWTSSAITWYLDDVQYQVIDITPAELSELRATQFFIFNVAVGGNWPGNPDGTTVFPQQMLVDYIRVFQ